MIKKILKAMATVTLLSVLTRAFSFIFRIYLSRKLGAEALGVFQIATSIFGLFVCFSASGLPITLSRKTAQFSALGQEGKTNSIFTTTLIISCSISVLICAFFYLFPQTLNFLFTNKQCNEIFLILLPSLITTAIYCTIRSWFWGKKQFTVFSITEMLEEILRIILTATFVNLVLFNGVHTKSVALAYLLGDIICAVILIIVFIKKGGKLGKPKYLMEVAASATPLTSTRLFGSFLSSIMAILLPTLLISTGLSTAQATASFGRMSGMVMPLILAPSTIVGSLAVVMVPELAGAISKGKTKSLANNVRKSITFSVIIASVFYLILVSCGQELGYMLYKDEIVGGLIISSAIIMIPLVTNQLCATMLNSLGQELWTFFTSIISSVALMLCVIFLPKHIGIMAYAVGLGIYHSLALILNLYKLKKKTTVKLTFLLDCGIFVLLGVFCGWLGNYIAKSLSISSAFLSIIISVTPALALFAIFTAVYAFAFNKFTWFRYGIKKAIKK